MTSAPAAAFGPYRFYDTLPLPSAAVGLLLAAAYYGAFLLYAWAMGWTTGDPSGSLTFKRYFAFELLNAALVGYLPTATVLALRGAARDLQALRPALRLDEEHFQTTLGALGRFAPTPLVCASLVGIGVGLWLPFTRSYWAGDRPPLGSPILAWNLAKLALQAWLVMLAVFVELVLATRLSRLGREHARVDLLDLGPLAPFTRHGLRSVLLLMLFSVILSGNFLAPWPVDIAAAVIVGLFFVALAAMVLPVHGVHRRIVETKRAALGRVTEAIRVESEALLAGDAGRDARLASLVAYRSLLAGASTWPFDLSTYLRFALYVSVGLGSWLGGALVERAVNVLLG